MTRRIAIIGYIFIFILILKQSLFATVGIIKGQVIDKETKEPLFGVEITVLGTTLGDITDKKGNYSINNVPVGAYMVTVRMMGYAAITKENVIVTTDLITTLNFKLETTFIEIDEVIVEAKHPIFRKDITASAHFTSGKDIEQMPVESFIDVIELQPGVVAGHFRGGRKSEVLYLVDGIPILDPTRGGPGSILSKGSIVEMVVRTGGFEAEFGKAMSGVVNLVTRTGGEELEAKIWGSYDKLGTFVPNHDITSFEDGQKYEAIVGGSWGKRMKFFLSGDYQRGNSRFKEEMLTVFPTPIDEKANASGKTTLRLAKNLKISLSSLFSNRNWYEYEHKWKKNLKGLPSQQRQSYRFSTTLTHALSKFTFYKFSLSQYNLLYQVFGKDARLYNPNIEYDSKGYIIKGDQAWWQDNRQVISSINGSITSQINEFHQIKSGGEFIYYDLYMNNVHYRPMKTMTPDFPVYIAYQTQYAYYPKSAAFYIQDKFRYQGMVADIGLRFDWFDPCASRPAIERDPYLRIEDWVVILKDKVKASPKSQLSPRFGFAFPTGEFDVIRFGYGHFFQMPLFEYLYTNVDYNLNTGYPPLVGDPDLNPAKTIAYEVSIKHFFSQNTVIIATVFSKEVSNLVDLQTYIIPEDEESDLAPGYSKYTNMSYANIKGFEIDLQKVYGRLLTGRLSYTFQIAKGTGSTVGSDVEEELTYWGIAIPTETFYLSWDQRHTLVLDVDIRDKDKWGINVLWRWNSPLPYTSNVEKPNFERMSPRYWLDIKAEKTFHLMQKKLSLFIEIKNLFDKQNTLWVDWEGEPGGELADPTAWSPGRRIWAGLNITL